jgi:hypothetical protein
VWGGAVRCCMGRGTFQVHPTPQLLSQSPELPSPPAPRCCRRSAT